MYLRNVWVSALGLAASATLATSIVACGGGGTTSAPPAAAPTGERVDAATAGEVSGMVMLDGKAPDNAPIRMNADPVCVKENTTPQSQETYTVGSDGKVKDVQLIAGPDLLVQSAMEAVWQWVYRPTLLNGEPIEVLTQVDVNYTLTQ